MKKKYRRIYALSLVFVFIIVAPLLILYATGFRYDFNEYKVIKTGVLAVDSDPRNAQIEINGEATGSKTPKVIKNLFPGEYSVSIEKLGYFPWEKTLPVFANQSTTTERVGLLKTDSPTLVAEEKVTDLIFSADNSYFAYVTNTNDTNPALTVKQQNTLRTVLSISKIESGQQPVFSEDERFIFLQDIKTNYISRILSLSGQYDILLKDITGFSISDLIATGTDSALYTVSENGLSRLNLAENSIQLLIAGQIQDALVINESVYYIQNKDNYPVLYQSSAINFNSAEEISTFSSNDQYQLSHSAQGYLTVHDQKNKELSLIKIQNQFSITLDKLNPDVIGFSWSPDASNLLLYNDFEIWVYNPELKQQDLLIRSSGKIKYATWSPDGKWIIYSQEGFIKAIELDGRGKRNMLNLAQTDSIPFGVNINTRVMFYYDSSQNLFQKQLQ
ncbi:MAG: PEGA domain-containing protein [Patescibacteria group bacterium]|jgi:hypothetical protein